MTCACGDAPCPGICAAHPEAMDVEEFSFEEAAMQARMVVPVSRERDV